MHWPISRGPLRELELCAGSHQSKLTQKRPSVGHPRVMYTLLVALLSKQAGFTISQNYADILPGIVW